MGVKIEKPGEPGHPGGNRRIYVRVNYQGRRKTRVFNTTKAAEAYATKVESILKDVALGKGAAELQGVFAGPEQRAKGEPVAPAPTFAEAAEKWQAIDGPSFKTGTRDTYENMLQKHILPVFGPRPIRDITETDVEGWWANLLQRKFTREHLAKIRRVLAGVFRRAIRHKFVTSTPVEVIMTRLRSDGEEVRQVDWLTEVELGRFLAVAAEREPRHYAFFLLQATGGLRFGECWALRVQDLDLTESLIHVRRAMRKHRVSSPKSGRPRTVHLPRSVVPALQNWVDTVRAEAAVRGEEARWLFPGLRSGEPMDDRFIRQAFTRCLRAAGITRHIRPHDLRHTYASLAIQRGVRLVVVSRQLGHKGIGVTADVYGHLDPETTREAAAAWEEIAGAVLPSPGRNPDATPALQPS